MQTVDGPVENAALPGIVGVDHIGLAVPDLTAAVHLHTAVLGGRLEHREENVEQGVVEVMIAFDGGTRVQLLAPTSPDSPVGRFLASRGPGMHHLAYRVSDIGSAAGALRARGMRLLSDTDRLGTAGSRILFVHPRDAGGVLVELVQPARTDQVGTGAAG
ncbi:methylmalonyl-CoA epimerase [Nakamurella flavida]|uniref:Methylmalonyl-CoA epimerase n=2 Tax=Nakamurella flavida TaxID=363630 RepID=A0A938YNN0_9ACTN|nr:methylmalonyl-CoA epimerase [Nakamurella flavida]